MVKSQRIPLSMIGSDNDFSKKESQQFMRENIVEKKLYHYPNRKHNTIKVTLIYPNKKYVGMNKNG